MAEGEGGSGGGGGGVDPWIWLFLVILLAAVLGGGSGNGLSFFGGSSNIKFGSPSTGENVEEEIRSSPFSGGGFGLPSPLPLPQPLPLPTPLPAPSTPGAQPTQTTATPSPDQLSMQAFGNTRLPYETEYVQLYATAGGNARIILTGMVLKNRNNESATIGPDENGNPIILLPGERATISTIASPRGFNFKLNKCSGYLAQSKLYYPGISNACPRLTLLPQTRDLTEGCQRYLDLLTSCTTPNINFETNIDNKCSEFVGQHASYPGCVNDFKNTPDFDQKEWRIYLARPREMWSNFQEDVYLYSRTGILITKTSY